VLFRSNNTQINILGTRYSVHHQMLNTRVHVVA